MEIKPFKGYRYNSAIAGDIGRCVCPPYDVIDEKLQKSLYEKSEHNIVRITRGKGKPDDNESNNCYTRAADFFSRLTETGALTPDSKETIYAYIQDFQIAGQHFCRSGLVALGKLEKFGSGVSPHEKTLDGPKADRLKLLQATKAHFGQIFMLYDDPQNTAAKIISKAAAGPVLLDFTDDEDVRHRLYAIDRQADIGALVRMMSSKNVIIADGHHRYETALNYYTQTNNPAAAYVMMTLVNMQDTGLVILPTHRLIKGVPDFNTHGLLERIRTDFDISGFAFKTLKEKNTARAKMFEQSGNFHRKNITALGLYAADSAFYVISLKNAGAMNAMGTQMSEAAKKLDVNVLHKLILEKAMGIGETQLASQSNIEYIKDIGNAIDNSIEKVDKGDCQAVFFMNPTRIEHVRAIAGAGEKMPQKSTFFHPKFFSGVVIYKIQ